MVGHPEVTPKSGGPSRVRLTYGSSYWKQVVNFDVLVDKGAISPRDLDLFEFADTPDQAFDLLRDNLTQTDT